MRCTRHGRACAEPPPIVHRPASTSRYLVRQLLGQGGFASVYRVAQLPDHDRSLSSRRALRGEHGSLSVHAAAHHNMNHYALKVISKCRLGDSAKGRDALRKEVSIHRQLSHPSIVKLISYWEDNYRIFLLMHLIDGPSLEDYVHARGRLSESEASAYSLHIFQALAYLHANRIVHRDIKLANLLLSPDLSRAMLCDFGLADHLDSIKNNPTTTVCGTPNYVAPELLTSSILRPSSKPRTIKTVAHTTSADAWSMGIVLYTMLVGSGPFDSDDVSRTFRRIRAARFTFPIGLKISANAKCLIRSLLTEDRHKRPTVEQAMQHPFFASHDIYKPLPEPTLDMENTPTNIKARPARVDRIDRTSNRAERKHSHVGSRRADSRPRSSSNCTAATLASRMQDASQLKNVRMDRRDADHSQQLQSRPLPVAQQERRSSYNSPQTLKKTGHTDHNTLNANSVGVVGGGQRSRVSHSGRNSSLKSSKRQSELLNLSVMLSAAIIKGRQFLDNDSQRDSNIPKRVRFEAVAKRVNAVANAPPLVQRWLDYTSKYGFATMMEDGRTGCCFNDSSIMFQVSETAEIPDLAYIPAVDADTEADATSKSPDLTKKACLCSMFAEMMVDGGRGTMYNLPSVCNISFLKPDLESSDKKPHSAFAEDCKQVHVREWARFRKFRAAAFRLSNNFIHVKFDIGEDFCDDYVFDPLQRTLYYRPAKARSAYLCAAKHLGEFSSHSEKVHSQLELCCQAISRFLE